MIKGLLDYGYFIVHELKKIYKQMKTAEIIVIIGILISGLIMIILGQLYNYPHDLLNLTFFLTFGGLVGLCLYSLIQAKFLIYKIAFALLTLQTMGILFKIMHWPGADVLLIIGILSTIFIIGLLIKTGVELRNVLRYQVAFNFMIAGILLLQLILAFTDNANIDLRLHYFLLAVIITMKLSGTILRIAESRMLTIIMIYSVFLVVTDAINSLKSIFENLG